MDGTVEGVESFGDFWGVKESQVKRKEISGGALRENTVIDCRGKFIMLRKDSRGCIWETHVVSQQIRGYTRRCLDEWRWAIL